MSRIVLVCFMASGKTRVGRALASLLGWDFLDFDRVIEEETRLTIPEVFQRFGETRFRELESDVGRRLMRLNQVVLAPGGGWPAHPGRMESLPKGTLSVWLRVDLEVAVERAQREGPTRPMLACGDPMERARDLLLEREPFYRLAHLTIDSSLAEPDILAQRIRDYFFEGGADRIHASPPQQ